MSYRLPTSVLLITTVLGSAPAADPSPSVPSARSSGTVEESPEVRALMKRRDLLREVFEDRFKEFEKFRGSVPLLQLASRHLLEAELDLPNSPADRVTAYRRNVDQLKAVEVIDRKRFQQGREPRSDYVTPKDLRVEAELRLHQARREAAGDALTESDKAQTWQLLYQWRQAVEQVLVVQMDEFGANIATGGLLLDTCRRMLRADLAGADGINGRRTAYERHLERLKPIERLNKVRLDAGRCAAEDYLEAKAARLEAEVYLLQTGPKAAEAACTVRALLREQRDVLRDAVEARVRGYIAGRGVLEFLLGTSRRLLDADLALAGNPEERIAACREHFERMKKVEGIDRERSEKGATPRRDWQQVRAARLEAEALLLRATGGVGPERP